MKEFVFLYRGAATAPLSPEQSQKQMQRWMTWLKDLGEKGHVKNMGNPLERGGRVVTGKPGAITDGPFAETKDVIGGYSLILAENLDQAAQLARGCPTFEAGGYVEVRPVQAM